MIAHFPAGVSPSDLFGPGSIYLPILTATQSYIASVSWGPSVPLLIVELYSDKLITYKEYEQQNAFNVLAA